MWFKNLQIYLLPTSWSLNAEAIEAALLKHPLLPVNQASMQSQGWVPVRDGGGLIHTTGLQVLIALGIEQRILPASVIAEAVKVKAKQLHETQGFPPGRKQLRDIKDQVIDELRPRSFVRRRTVRAWIDWTRGRIIVDTPSSKVAEHLLTVLRADIGDLPAVPFDTKGSAARAMAHWIVSGDSPTHFQPAEDCELLADNPTKAAVRYARHSLDGPELRSLINGGKQVARLGLTWRDRVSFALTDKLVMKRVRFVDVTEDKAASKNSGDAFDVDFHLMTGELGALIADLADALGGIKK